MNMTKSADSIVTNIIRYSASHYYRQFLGIFTAIIRPKLLSPELYGLWNLLKLIQNYGTYTHLGARTSMRYQIPFHESRKEDKQIQLIAGTTFKGSLWLTIFFAALIAGISFKPGLSVEAKTGLLSFSIVVLLLWYYGYVTSLLKSYQNFKLISASNYIYFTAIFICSVVFIYFWGIYGAYLSVIMPLIIVIFYLRLKYTQPISNNFQKEILFELIKKGFPIVLFNVAALLISTSDRFIVAYFLGNEQLGYYGIAIMCMGFLMNTPGASREVIEPKMMQSFGKNSAEDGINKYFLKPLINSAYLMPFLIGIVFFMLPLVIPLILPKYIAGILPSQIIVIGSYALALSYTVRGIVIAKGWQVQASGLMFIALSINILLNIIFIKTGFGITGVAVASSTSFFILLVLLLVFVSIKDTSISEKLKSVFLSLCYPFPLMLFIILLLEYCDKYIAQNALIIALVKLLIFCLIYLILFIVTRNKHTVIDLFTMRKS